MKFKTILRKSYGFMLVALAGMMVFPGNVSAAEKDDLFRKTDWDGSEKYVVWAGIPLVAEYNPENKITFVGCDTPENYDKYMKALRDNASDDVLVGLRSEKKCLILSNDTFYYIEIKEMDEISGQVTQIMRDFNGFTDGPFFTNITPDKRLIRTSPYLESVEQRVRKAPFLFMEKKGKKPFTLTRSKFFCNSINDFREYQYKRHTEESDLKKVAAIYELQGKCFWIEKNTTMQAVFVNRYRDVEYKILSGPYEGRVVAADRNI